MIGHEAAIVNDASKPEGVFARVGDCRRMFDYYRPRIGLNEGIRRSFEYQTGGGLVPRRKPVAADAIVATAGWMPGNRAGEGQLP